MYPRVKVLKIHLESMKIFRDICLLLEALESLELGWYTKKRLNFHCTVTDIPQISSERLWSSETYTSVV